MTDEEPAERSIDALRRAASERPDEADAHTALAMALFHEFMRRWGTGRSSKRDPRLTIGLELSATLRRLATLAPLRRSEFAVAGSIFQPFHVSRGEFDAAEALARAVLDGVRPLAESEGPASERWEHVADSLDTLASVARERGEPDAERSLREELLGIRRTMAAIDGEQRTWLADALRDHAAMEDRDGRVVLALELLAEAVDVARAVFADEPEDPWSVVGVVDALAERASILKCAGRPTEARAAAEEAASIVRAEAAAGRDVDWDGFADVLEHLTDLASDRKDWAAGVAAGEERVAALRRAAAEPDAGPWIAGDLDDAMLEVGDLYFATDFVAARTAYESALAHLKERAASAPDDPEPLERAGNVLKMLARTAQALGDDVGARQLYARMREAFADARRRFPDHADLAISHRLGLMRAAGLHCDAGEFDAALPLHLEQLAISRALTAVEDSNRVRSGLVHDLVDLGDVHVSRGDHGEAATAFREAVEVARVLAAADPADWDEPNAVIRALWRLRDALRETKAAEDALVAAAEVVSLRRRLAADDPTDLEILRELVVDLDELGDCLRDTGNLAGAVASYSEAETFARGLVATDGARAQWRDDLSIVLGRLARTELDRGNVATAVALFDESAAELRVLASREPDVVTWRRKLGLRLSDLGEARTAAGDRDGALAAYEESVALLVPTHGDDDGISSESLRDTLVDAADAASAAGRADVASVFRARAERLPVAD